MNPASKLSLHYFHPDTYDSAKNLRIVYALCLIASYTTLFFSKCKIKIVIIEIFWTYQFSFFSIFQYKNINPHIFALIEVFRWSNGFNFGYSDSSIEQSYYSAIQYSVQILNNINIMLLVPIIMVVASLIGEAICYCLNRPNKVQAMNSKLYDIFTYSILLSLPNMGVNWIIEVFYSF